MKNYKEFGFKTAQAVDDPSKYGDIISSFLQSQEDCVKKDCDSVAEAKKIRNSLSCLVNNRGLSDKIKVCLRKNSVFLKRIGE